MDRRGLKPWGLGVLQILANLMFSGQNLYEYIIFLVGEYISISCHIKM
jgi:hypothetical protein